MPLDKDTALNRETWRLFRIISEFVDGFEVMSEVGPAISIFGSARTQPDELPYQRAVECGRKVAEQNFAVITGGGPGIMEAANKGAFEIGGKSIGLNINLPMEQDPNPFQNYELSFRYFFVRKVMFVKYACGFIIFPGGFGTMDEFFESITLIQTLKIEPFPVVLVGTNFWSGLLDWVKNTMRDQYDTISPEDMDLFHLTDDVDEAIEYITKRFNQDQWDARTEPTIPEPLIQQVKKGHSGIIEPGLKHLRNTTNPNES